MQFVHIRGNFTRLERRRDPCVEERSRNGLRDHLRYDRPAVSTQNNRFLRISNTRILQTLVTHNNRVCTDMIGGNYPFLPGFTTGAETPSDPAVRCLLNGETYDSMCGSGEEPMGSLHRLCACSLAPTGPLGGSPESSGVSTTTAPESSGVGTTTVSEFVDATSTSQDHTQCPHWHFSA